MPPRRLRPLSVSRTPRGEERPSTAEDAAVPFTPRRVGSGQQAQRQQKQQQPQSATGRALKTMRSITQAHRLMGLSRRHGTGVFTHRMGARDSCAHEDDSGIGGVGSATSSGNDGGEPGAIWEVLRAGKGQMALPTAKDLAQLPRTLQKTFKCLAMETLSTYLYPRVLLCQRKQERARMQAMSTCPRLTVEHLSRQQLFKNCTPDDLRTIIEKLELCVYDKGEYIIHEGDRSGSGIFFVATGQVSIWKKADRQSKAVGAANGSLLVVLGPVACVGEFAFLTEEPRMATIQAQCRVECWVLKKSDFYAFIQRLPEHAFASIVESAFATRNNTMHMSYPISANLLRLRSVFTPCTGPIVDEYLSILQPYAVPKNYCVAKGDQRMDRILFLQNGRCAVLRKLRVQNDSATPPLPPAGGAKGATPAANAITSSAAATHVHTLRAPCVIGDTAVLHRGVMGDTIVTLSTCDFWVLGREAFLQVLRRYPAVEKQMMQAAREQRQTQLSTQHNLFRDCVRSIPFLRDLAPPGALRELVNLFKARVYKPLSVICSTAVYADRLIILYKGTVRVEDSLFARPWLPGEAQGFTCIVPHKWARLAVSSDVSECLELERDTYVAFLRRHKLYKGMHHFAKLLMFPKAFPPREVEVAEQSMADLKTPRLYPCSDATAFSLTEPGFAGAHYASMLEARGVEGRRGRPWIRCSTYLWRRNYKEETAEQRPAKASDRKLFDALRSVGNNDGEGGSGRQRRKTLQVTQ